MLDCSISVVALTTLSGIILSIVAEVNIQLCVSEKVFGRCCRHVGEGDGGPEGGDGTASAP